MHITTAQAADRLGLSVQRIRAMCAAGAIPASKIGRDWVIDGACLDSVKVYGKAGRPKRPTCPTCDDTGQPQQFP